MSFGALNLRCCVWVAFFCSSLVSSGTAGEAPRLIILFTGDTHAALEPCTCPVQPGGGVVRRATLIDTYRKKYPDRVLLVDAGGFFAGGIYDPASKNKEADLVRSYAAAEFLAALKPDAVALGDEELKLGLAPINRIQEKFPLPCISSATRCNFVPHPLRGTIAWAIRANKIRNARGHQRVAFQIFWPQE